MPGYCYACEVELAKRLRTRADGTAIRPVFPEDWHCSGCWGRGDDIDRPVTVANVFAPTRAPSSTRDVQRSKVYRAEDRWQHAWVAEHGPFRRFETTAEIEAWIHETSAKATFQRRWGKSVHVNPPTVRPGYGARSARGGSTSMTFPLWSRNAYIVLHELAHCLESRVGRRAQAHGWEFCDTLLELVGVVHGAEAQRTLRAEFKKSKVRVAPKREVTPAQRAAWATSLAAANAARTAKQGGDQ